MVVQNIALATVALLAISCERPGPAMDTEFVGRIERLGFFKYVEPSRLEDAKANVRADGWIGVFGENGRLFDADAENLAEGGVGEFLAEVGAFLNQQGATVSAVEENFGEGKYAVIVRGREYVIWSADELARSEEQVGLLWGLSTVRTFALVNSLLEEAGSGERLYAVNGGNDLNGFFLTVELRDALCSHPNATLESRPYLPEPEHPWFGQEHE